MKVILYVVSWKYISEQNCDYFMSSEGKFILYSACGLEFPLNQYNQI